MTDEHDNAGEAGRRARLFGLVASGLGLLSPDDCEALIGEAGGDIGRSPEALLDLAASKGLLAEKDRELILAAADIIVENSEGDLEAALRAMDRDGHDHGGSAMAGDPPATAPDAGGTLTFSEDGSDQTLTVDRLPGDVPPGGDPSREAPGDRTLAPGEVPEDMPGSSSFDRYTLKERLGECMPQDNDEGITSEHPGRYTIKGEYGRGAIGRVLVAFDEHVGRDVALKELLTGRGTGSPAGSDPTTGRTTQATRRFLREARITGQLEHPGIVPVYEIGRRRDGSTYYTMKVVHGATLAERLKKCDNIRQRLRLLSNFLDLCNTMAFAHDKGVVHRDLKPANVMVGEFGETIVLDWGLAKHRELEDERARDLAESLRLIAESGAAETMRGLPLGTPSYMSPEQAEGRVEDIDERSDIWSLGAILHELLAGQPPFRGKTAFEVMGKVVSAPLEPIREQNPEAPPELAAIAEKCLAKKPADRYQSAAELAADVANFQAGGLVSAYEYSTAKLLLRWVRKRWPVVATAAAALAVIVAFYAWSYVKIDRERDRALVSEGVALQKEKEAETNLAESYLIMGRWAEARREWDSARVLFAKSLTLNDTLVARHSINHVSSVPPIRLASSRMLEGSQGLVWALDFTSGKVIALGRGEKGILAWDGDSGKKVGEYACDAGSVSGIDLNAPARRIAAAFRDKTVRVWALDTGKQLCVLSDNRARINRLRLGPDGKRVATAAADYVIRIWDVSTGEPAHELEWDRDDVTSMEWSGDGSMLITANGDGRAKVWDADSGELRFRLEEHRDGIVQARFAPDGTTAATAGFDRSAKVWSLEDGSLLYTLEGHQDDIYDLAYAPWGNVLASGGADSTLRLWDLNNGSMIHLIEGHKGAVLSIDFSRDGKYVASRANDLTLKVWDAEHGSLAYARGGMAGEAVFDPDGGRLALSGSEHMLHIWEIGDRTRLESLAALALSVEVASFGPAGRRLLVGGEFGEVAVVDAISDEVLARLPNHEDPVCAAAWSPGGRLAASGGHDRAVMVHDPAGGGLVFSLDIHDDSVCALAFTNDGEALISGDQGGRLFVTDIADPEASRQLLQMDTGVKEIALAADGKKAAVLGLLGPSVYMVSLETGATSSYSIEGGFIEDMALSPDGSRIFVADSEGRLTGWDTASGERVFHVEAHQCSARALALYPGGKRLASSGCDQAVRLWDIGQGVRVFEALGHKSAVDRLELLPGGRSLASAGEDGMVMLWDAATGEALHSLPGKGARAPALVVAPGGARLATVSGDKEVRVWPFIEDIMSGPPEALLDRSERAAGLKLRGTRLHPWSPEDRLISSTPLPQSF